ncbi:14694_t:CDS:2, partial [Gigaspora margarita]
DDIKDDKVNEYNVQQVTKALGKDNNKKKKTYFDETYSENASEGPIGTDGFEKQIEIAKMENPFDNVYKNPNTIGV